MESVARASVSLAAATGAAAQITEDNWGINADHLLVYFS
jgi:hypothetical protein